MSAYDAIVEAATWSETRVGPPLPARLRPEARPHPAHKDAARQIAFALAHDACCPAEAWLGCGVALRRLLTAREAFGLAIAALGAVEDAHLGDLMDAAFEPEMGDPFPATPDRRRLLEDADWWAGNASRREREAYALACLVRMSPADRAALLRAVSEAAP